MMQVNIADAATELPELVHLIEAGQEQQVVLLREGKPVAALKQYHSEIEPAGERRGIKIGIAKGELNYYGDFDECNDEIAEMFGVA